MTTSTDVVPRAPKAIGRLFDDPSFFRPLCEANAPYLPVQRYATNAAEAEIIGDVNSSSKGHLIVAPTFRGDWAYDEPLIDGAERFLENERLIDAAKALFDAELVIPQIVYANLTWQLPFHQGGGHIDVPAFRGIDRTEYPVWLLTVMNHSKLFRAHQIQIATAVCWFYTGTDGGLEYWPQGAHQPPVVHEGRIDNSAIVGDNDHMFHRVRPVGEPSDGLIGGLSLDSELSYLDHSWAITEGGEQLATFGWDRLRVSVSWKAQVFENPAQHELVLSHEDDLSLDQVVDTFLGDLATKGVTVEAPSDPLAEKAWIAALGSAYVREPA